MRKIDEYVFKTLKLALLALAILCFLSPQTQAATYTLVKTIDLDPLVGNNQSIEVDVVGDELYVANWGQDLYYRIDPVTGTLLGSFSLGNGILIDNHGSEYAGGSIFHASDDDYGSSPLGSDLFFETDTDGVVLSGPYDLFGTGDNSEDPNGLTVDPVTGRIWVSTVTPDGIHEINPSDGTILNHIDVGGAWALGFNPNSGKLFFADGSGVIKEVAPDGSGLATVFDPAVGQVLGMAFTSSGDLALLDFGSAIPPSRILLYDSSDDADNVFTTTLVPEPSAKPPLKPGNPGLPGCLAEVAAKEAQIADLQAEIDKLENTAFVRQTGQTDCYDQSGNPLPSCDGTGQDGEYQMVVAWPVPRFTDNLNGTVTDNFTKLTWMENANCDGRKPWADAVDFCNNLASGSCGLTDGSNPGDWRLPNINEMVSLIHWGVYNPAVPNTMGTGQLSSGDPFINVETLGGIPHYWSSTTFIYQPGPAEAFCVPLSSGGIDDLPKTLGLHAWCVKGGN
jgi:hypothetical protein